MPISGQSRQHIACPFPRCPSRGIKSEQNFCWEHAVSLDAVLKYRLRQNQKDALEEAVNILHTAVRYRAGDAVVAAELREAYRRRSQVVAAQPDAPEGEEWRLQRPQALRRS